MNEPPDHTAVFSAENLLSPAGITVPKYFFKISGCSFSAVSVSGRSRLGPRGPPGSGDRRPRVVHDQALGHEVVRPVNLDVI